jgi:1-deoxy-D-xylulose-5-phosphate reductoisomerase
MRLHNKQKKHVAILGSTGSIGVNTLNVIREHMDDFKVVALATRGNIDLLLKQVREFKPVIVAIADERCAKVFIKQGKSSVRVAAGMEGLIKIASIREADIVVSAIVGAAGLLPTIEAVKSGKTIALANKEVLVTAGEIVMRLAQEHKAEIIPVDSEHSAVFQCLRGEDKSSVKRLILTASGGPFLNHHADKLYKVSSKEALKHPRWDMGKKITIDSATMMNKGFEVIEAHWLFGVDISKIDVVIHPQSIIHSMVEFRDGAILAQMGEPDMKVPIQYALTYPNRMQRNSQEFDFIKNNILTFAAPDLEKFPCLELAYEAIKAGGTMPTVLNTVNEVAVARFLKNEIKFTDIPKLIKKAMDSHKVLENPGIDDILKIDEAIRREKFA